MAPAITTHPHTPIISDPEEAKQIGMLLGLTVLDMDSLHHDPEAQVILVRRRLIAMIEDEAGSAAERIKSALEMLSTLSPPEKRAKITYVGRRNAS